MRIDLLARLLLIASAPAAWAAGCGGEVAAEGTQGAVDLQAGAAGQGGTVQNSAGQSGAGAGGAGLGGAGAGGAGSGGGGSAGQGGQGGAAVGCALGAPCVEDSWCHYATSSGSSLHCVSGAYGNGDQMPSQIKVCVDKTGECLGNVPELYPILTAEYSEPCTSIMDPTTPPVQVASSGAERCCYEVLAVCVGRPLWVGAGPRLALLATNRAWA